MGAVAVVVEGVVVVVDEVPPNDVVYVTVAAIVYAVFPALIVEQIASIDPSIPIEVGDAAGVLRIVEVVEGEQPILVHINQSGAQLRGNLVLVDPHVQVEVGVGIVDPGVDDSGDHLG
ncbi:hypothetical protein D3C78_1366180 [compost metagenome]